jgi:hypothetical protein
VVSVREVGEDDGDGDVEDGGVVGSDGFQVWDSVWPNEGWRWIGVVDRLG